MTTTLSRRQVLRGMCAGAAAAAASQVWAPAAAFADRADHTLVTIFLRGGLDGLSAVVPFADQRYHDLRPTIAVPGADRLPIAPGFGLHPALAPLHDLRSMLAVVHATGQVHGTRSHFDAQHLVEMGADQPTQHANGWLTRHLAAQGASSAPLHAVSWGGTPAASLAGDPSALSLTRMSDFGLASDWRVADDVATTLRQMYGDGDLTSSRARATLDALTRVDAIRHAAPEPRVTYPESNLGRALAEVAVTIKADAGLVAATVDVGGWDTHANIGDPSDGYLARKLDDLGRSVQAFVRDLGGRMKNTTVVTMSEFGRRVAENGSGGVDHGRGTAMFVLGDGVRPGVHGDWWGLEDGVLDRGDVPVVTDHRQVLGDVLVGRLGASHLDQVFPGMARRPVGIA